MPVHARDAASLLPRIRVAPARHNLGADGALLEGPVLRALRPRTAGRAALSGATPTPLLRTHRAEDEILSLQGCEEY